MKKHAIKHTKGKDAINFPVEETNCKDDHDGTLPDKTNVSE